MADESTTTTTTTTTRAPGRPTGQPANRSEQAPDQRQAVQDYVRGHLLRVAKDVIAEAESLGRRGFRGLKANLMDASKDLHEGKPAKAEAKLTATAEKAKEAGLDSDADKIQAEAYRIMSGEA